MEHVLQKLGLSEKETQLYLALLQQKQACSAVELAAYTSLPRTTLYDVLLTLVEKGLVIEKKRGATKVFEVDSPHHLFAFVHKQEMQIEEGKSSLHSIMSDLERLKNPLLPAPQMALFVGEQALTQMWDMQVANSIAEEKYIRFLCNAHFFAQMSGELKALGKRFADQGCVVKVLVYSPEEDPIFLKSRNFEVKTLRQEITFTSGMDVIGSYIGYWTQEGTQVHASSMENPHIARMHHALFETLWALEL